MTEQQIILLIVAAIIFTGLLIAFYVLRITLPASYRERMTTLNQQNMERMALIERNMDPSLAMPPKPKGAGSDPLLWGLLFVGIGLGAFLGNVYAFYSGIDKKTTTDALGLLFGGIGLVGYYLLKGRSGK